MSLVNFIVHSIFLPFFHVCFNISNILYQLHSLFFPVLSVFSLLVINTSFLFHGSYIFCMSFFLPFPHFNKSLIYTFDLLSFLSVHFIFNLLLLFLFLSFFHFLFYLLIHSQFKKFLIFRKYILYFLSISIVLHYYFFNFFSFYLFSIYFYGLFYNAIFYFLNFILFLLFIFHFRNFFFPLVSTFINSHFINLTILSPHLPHPIKHPFFFKTLYFLLIHIFIPSSLHSLYFTLPVILPSLSIYLSSVTICIS